MNHSILRPILLCIGWLVIGAAIMTGVLGIQVQWNLFDFHPEWDAKVLGYGVLLLSALVGSWFIARATRDQASRVVSLVICILLSVLGVLVCRPEETSQETSLDSDIFSLLHSEPSPIWFRGGLALVLFLPSIFWILWRLRSNRSGD
jgi:uncharacterized membrane protein